MGGVNRIDNPDFHFKPDHPSQLGPKGEPQANVRLHQLPLTYASICASANATFGCGKSTAFTQREGARVSVTDRGWTGMARRLEKDSNPVMLCCRRGRKETGIGNRRVATAGSKPIRMKRGTIDDKPFERHTHIVCCQACCMQNAGLCVLPFASSPHPWPQLLVKRRSSSSSTTPGTLRLR